jgi:4-hydroxybenzoate polyprenyltransferase
VAKKINIYGFRINEWYFSKAAGLSGLLFVFAALFGIPFYNFTLHIIPAVISLIGIAALGYIINDISDIEQDLKSGKKNKTAGLSKIQKLLLIGFTSLLAFAPWVFLPFTKLSIFLLLTELLLFVLYSFKPFRLKEIKILGLLCDALYAHVVPGFLAAYTFLLIADIEPDILFFVLFLFWQFFLGLRNIMQHHIYDRKKDAISNAYNAYNHYKLSLIQWLCYLILPAEILLFSALMLYFVSISYWFLVLWIWYFAEQIFTKKWPFKQALVWRYKKGLFSVSFFYEQRFALIAGLILCSHDFRFALALLIYLFVFKINLHRIRALIRYVLFRFVYVYYATVVRFYHHVFLKYAYHYGHQLKKKLGLLKPTENNGEQ